MPDETTPEASATGANAHTLDHDAGEPLALRLSETILQSHEVNSVSDMLDVASVFYTSAATICGSLCGACLFPLMVSRTGANPVAWLALLLATVAGGGAAGAATAAIIFNARGYLSWEKRTRPGHDPFAESKPQPAISKPRT